MDSITKSKQKTLSRGALFSVLNQFEQIFLAIKRIVVADDSRAVIDNPVFLVSLKAANQFRFFKFSKKARKNTWFDFFQQSFSTICFITRKTTGQPFVQAALKIFTNLDVRALSARAAAANGILAAATTRQTAAAKAQFLFHRHSLLVSL